MAGGQAWTPRDPEIRNFLRSQWYEMPRAAGSKGNGALSALQDVVGGRWDTLAGHFWIPQAT